MCHKLNDEQALNVAQQGSRNSTSFPRSSPSWGPVVPVNESFVESLVPLEVVRTHTCWLSTWALVTPPAWSSLEKGCLHPYLSFSLSYSSLTSLSAPQILGFLPCLGHSGFHPLEPHDVALPGRNHSSSYTILGTGPLSGVMVNESLINRHPFSMTPPIGCNIQLLAWASRKSSAEIPRQIGRQ